jgi:4-hydroxy-tetrahydrodipicolinate reductase
MGRQLLSDALRDPSIEVVGAIDVPGAAPIGVDIGNLCDHAPTGVFVTDNLESTLPQTDVVIEFTDPAATLGNLPIVQRYGKAYVIGTTGIDEQGHQAIRDASAKIPVLAAASMSVGVNLIASILPTIVRVIEGSYDIEIIESHHRYKKDAPSGTALWLTQIIEDAMQHSTDHVRTYGRQGLAPRTEGEIGLHAVRAGGNPGEHHLVFANDGEQIELVIRAFNRQTYALGAMRAAKFLAGKDPGLYDMQDVLAEHSREE